jgi:hypothetical protein
MARKINLKGLYDTGDLTVTTINIVEDATSNGVSALFDGDSSVLKFQANQHVNSALREQLKLNFSQAIKGNKFRIRVTTKTTADYNIHLNGDTNNLQSVSGLAASVYFTSQNFNFSISSLNEIRISLGSSFSNGDHQVYEIELFITEEADPYEFNDSVLTTHAWNSSRYSGKQLSSTKINEYTAGDTTWAHTPVVSNYSRNIYIGSRVIGMREPGLGGAEDPTLTPFPGFSYITVDDYITVNSDDSITRRSIRGGRGSGDDLNAKKGFYQSWYQDFPIGTKTEIRPLDTKLAQSLSPRYNVFNNSGQLQKVLLVTQNHAVYTGSNADSMDYDSGSYYAASYNTSSQIFDYCLGSGNPNGTDIGGEFSVFNNLLLVTDFFTGSLIAAPQGVNNPIPSDDLTVSPEFGGGGGVVDNVDDNADRDYVGTSDNSDEDEQLNNQGSGEGTDTLGGGG